MWLHELSVSAAHRKLGLPSMDPAQPSQAEEHPEQSASLIWKQPPWTTSWPAPQQRPLRHEELPSVQAVPLGTAGLEQVPVAGLQVPATWH